MATFSYKAMTREGQLVSGEIKAASGEEVRRRLEYLELLPIDMSAAREAGRFGRRRLPAAAVTSFTRDLAFMLEAGFRIEQALDLLSDPQMSGPLAPTVKSLAAAVRAGESFASALQQFDTTFSPLHVALARIGESSGQLAAQMQVLAELRARMEAARARVIEQLRYPAFILLLATTVLVFFLRIVLPQFAATLRDLGGRMDMSTALLLGLSDFITEHGATLGLSAFAAATLGAVLLRRAGLREALNRIARRLPIAGDLLADYRTAIFCRTLAYLLINGMTLSKALPLATGALGGVATSAWAETLSKVRQGGTLASALSGNHDVAPLGARMLSLGEQAGRLGPVALQAAELFDLRLERGLKRVVDVAGPAAILATSLLVGLLVVTLMNALMSVGQIAN